MKRVIGLTGSMGAGKSTVSAYLKKKGICVIDADEISREITKTGQPGFNAIVHTFGREFLKADGSLDRRALGQAVFSDTERLKLLENVLHPLIIERMEDELSKADGTVVIDAPLLHKAGLDRLCGEVWVVSAPKDMRIERVLKRDGITREEAASRLESQMAPEELEAAADRVILNGGSKEDLIRRIEEVLHA